jgi:hypothetical protein
MLIFFTMEETKLILCQVKDFNQDQMLKKID